MSHSRIFHSYGMESTSPFQVKGCKFRTMWHSWHSMPLSNKQATVTEKWAIHSYGHFTGICCHALAVSCINYLFKRLRTVMTMDKKPISHMQSSIEVWVWIKNQLVLSWDQILIGQICTLTGPSQWCSGLKHLPRNQKVGCSNPSHDRPRKKR